MKVYNGSVIVWTEEAGEVFNNVNKAIDYFNECLEAGLHPIWERIWNERKR